MIPAKRAIKTQVKAIPTVVSFCADCREHTDKPRSELSEAGGVFFFCPGVEIVEVVRIHFFQSLWSLCQCNRVECSGGIDDVNIMQVKGKIDMICSFSDEFICSAQSGTRGPVIDDELENVSGVGDWDRLHH